MSVAISELKELMLRAPRLTLAVAESMTCGRVQAAVGAVSGASEFFLGGITAYSLDEKARHLGVNRAEAAKVDGVSADVAVEMARGVCALFGSDLGVATTGYAEAAVGQDVAVPMAWWAVAGRGPTGGFNVKAGRVEFPGASRVQAQERAAEAAMAALVAALRTIRG